MAGRKDNIKALFSNTRSRVIILFTVGFLLTAVIIGIIKISASTSASKTVSSADLTNAPAGMQSIPGSMDPTVQYASLQQAQNLAQARQAAKSGSSAIPTIIRSQAFGNGVDSVGPQQGQGGVGFETLAREDSGGTQQSLWVQSLKDSNCSKASVDKVVNEGAVLSDLKKACTCMQLKDDGYKLSDLKPVCACKALKAAGFNARQMKDAGSTASQLRLCGFDACELRAAGFTAQEMKDGGYSDGELKGAGYPENEIGRAGGLPDGITADDIRKAGCQPDALSRLRAAGVTAAAIRSISGCTAAQLKAAGYSAQDLKNAGFSAADLLKAGFSPAQLRDAGYSARDLMDAGVTPAQLAAAGYSPDEISEAEAQLPPGMSPDAIKAAGCNVEAIKRERLAGVSAALIHKYAGCSAQQLKAAGFTDADLANAGFSPAEIKATMPIVGDDSIKAAGCDPVQLKKLFMEGVSAKRIHDLNGCTAAELKAAGYDAKQLADAGFTPQQLLAAGFSAADVNAAKPLDDSAIRAAGCDPQKLHMLFLHGVSAKRIRDLNGCSAAALKAAGYNAKELADAGFTPQQLLAAGFTPAQVGAVDDSAIRAAGCDPKKLHALFLEGVSAKRIHDLNGCSAEALRAAGFSAKDLADAGFTPQELLAAGFTPEELKQAGLSPAGVIAAGRTSDCSVASLKAARALGVSALTIKQTLGCSAKQMKDAGYTAAELKAAGFTAAELKDAGFSAADLKAAGFTAKELKAAGFSAKDLKDAGFSAEQLKEAGFNAADLKNAGFSADQLRKAGFNAKELRAAGFSESDLKNAGFIPEDSAVASLRGPNQPIIPSAVMALPSLNGSVATPSASAEAANTKQLQEILKRQQSQVADQRFQDKIQQRTAAMLGVANQSLQAWRSVPTQIYVGGTPPKEVSGAGARDTSDGGINPSGLSQPTIGGSSSSAPSVVKSGDILFAVLDTSVNSDEPGPILATIVSGKLNGSKLIGSFTLPNNAEKMVINFNTMSVPGAAKTTSINAYAIDPNTARTALASHANHHYLLRYGSLFASTFLEGFGNAFQSANTTVQIGGTGGVSNTSISNGIGRTTLENAVIGLATLGKSWGQVAQQQFNTPITVTLCSGTGIGVLFTQDLASL